MAIELDDLNAGSSYGSKPVAIAPQTAITSVDLPDTDDVHLLARSATPMAIRTLIDIMQDKGAKPSERIAASGMLLDRAHGKAAQETVIKGDVVFNVVCGIVAPPNSIKTINSDGSTID